MAGFEVPAQTTVLLTEETGVGWDHPLSVEKLSPILSVYVEDGWEAGCERCIQILNFGGRGHTLVIHSQDEDVIWTFVMEKPTHRILINAPAAQGAVGYGTGLVPSMTLGCGAFGGNITSDNISAHNLVLTKHVGYCYDGFVESFPDFAKGPPTELRFAAMPVSPAPSVASGAGSGAVGTGSPVRAPRAPAPAAPLAHAGNPTHPSSPFFGRPSGEGRPGVPPLQPSGSAPAGPEPGAAERPGTPPPWAGGPIPAPRPVRYRR